MGMKFKYEGRWVNADQLRALRGVKPVEVKAPKVEKTIETSSESIEELRAAYEVKFGKPVANSYKNRAEWIQSKLNNK